MWKLPTLDGFRLAGKYILTLEEGSMTLPDTLEDEDAASIGRSFMEALHRIAPNFMWGTDPVEFLYRQQDDLDFWKTKYEFADKRAMESARLAGARLKDLHRWSDVAITICRTLNIQWPESEHFEDTVIAAYQKLDGHNTELLQQILRLPKPPDEMGDGPQERVDNILDLLRTAKEELQHWRSARKMLSSGSNSFKEAP